MKRIIAGLTVVLLLAGVLTGCGGKEEPAEGNSGQDQVNGAAQEQQPAQQTPAPTQPDATQPAPQPVAPQPLQEVPVGTVLDAPEVVFTDDCEKLYLYITSPGTTEGAVVSVEVALDYIAENNYILYFSDGVLKNSEAVYEVSDAGIAAYYRSSLVDDFVKDTEASQSELEAETNKIFETMAMCTLQHPMYEGLKYRKTDAPTVPITGEVLVYDIMEGNQVTGQVCVDKATGVAVSLTDAEGNSSFTVTEIKTSGDMGIPAYK